VETPTLLHISVSPRGNQSISRRLSDTAVEAWKESNPEGKGTKVLVIVASGGSYPEGTPMVALNYEVPYVSMHWNCLRSCVSDVGQQNSF